MEKTRVRPIVHLMGIDSPIALGDFGCNYGLNRAFPYSDFPDVIEGGLKEVKYSAMGYYSIYEKDGNYEGSRINTPYLGRYSSLPRVILSANTDRTKNLIIQDGPSHIGAIVKQGCPALPEGSEVMLYFKNKNIRSKRIRNNLIDPGEPIPVIHLSSDDIKNRMIGKLLR